jgi:light-regulated signal transduction histidine kinase (bacteriophytochrome)
VRTIVSLIEFLSVNYNKEIDSSGHEMMEFIIQAGHRMKALILGLLEYSRLGKERVVKKIDCNELVRDVKKDLSRSIDETGAKISFDDLPKIEGYETEFRLLIQNLLSNAIKFKKKDVHPIITITCIDNVNNWEFCVKDNGIGIAKKHKIKIFQIFQRLHAREEYEGYGLGLTHCRKIIELHQGKIWVRSELNNGCDFYFTIPKII